MADVTANGLAPEERHERTDFKVAVAVWFGIGVSVLTGGALLGMFALFQSLESAAGERDRVRTLRDGRAEAGPQERPPWPEDQLERLREYERDALEDYGWVDRTKGVVKIPIDKAMELIVERSARGGTGGAR